MAKLLKKIENLVQDASGKSSVGFSWGNNFWLGAERACYLLNEPPTISLVKSSNRKMLPNMTDIASKIPVEYRMFYASHTSTVQVKSIYNLLQQKVDEVKNLRSRY